MRLKATESCRGRPGSGAGEPGRRAEEGAAGTGLLHVPAGRSWGGPWLHMLGLNPVQPGALPVLVSGVGVLFLSCTLRAAVLPLWIVAIV